MSAVAPLARRIEVGELLPGAGPLSVAADIYVPAQIPRAADGAVLPARRCHVARLLRPAGARGLQLRRRRCARAATSSSRSIRWASATARDRRTATSSRPTMLARANAAAVAAIHAQLRSSGSSPGARSVRCAPSASATRWVPCSPASSRPTTPATQALMLFGFGTKGLVVALSEEEKRFAGDPAGTRANLVRLARLRSPDPYPPVPRTQQGRDLFAGRHCRPPRRRGPQPRARRTAADRRPVSP